MVNENFSKSTMNEQAIEVGMEAAKEIHQV